MIKIFRLRIYGEFPKKALQSPICQLIEFPQNNRKHPLKQCSLTDEIQNKAFQKVAYWFENQIFAGVDAPETISS